MPLYELQLFRQRTVYDQALIKVRAKNLEATQEVEEQVHKADEQVEDETLAWKILEVQ